MLKLKPPPLILSIPIQARSVKGSILIWSMMLGFILASVFFIFAMRQRAAITAQRDTMAILSAKEYLDSYAEYVEKLDPKDAVEKDALDKMKKDGVNYDGIKGTVTDNPTEINGMADFRESPADTYTFDTDSEIYVEWNRCPSSSEPAGQKGDLYFNAVLYKSEGTGCGKNKTYNDISPLSVKAAVPFTIKTSGIPFYYRITAKDSAVKLTDGKWYMDLSIDLVNGKKYTVKRGF